MQTVSIHEALSTRDCVLRGCPNEAEAGSEFCRHHAPAASSRPKAASVPVVTETSEPSQLRVCKVCGVYEREGAPPRGPFARLCQKHYDEERARISEAMKDANQRRAAMPPPSPSPNPSPEPESKPKPNRTATPEMLRPVPSTELAVPDISVAMTNVDDAAIALEHAKRRYADAVTDLQRHPRLAYLGLEVRHVETEYVEVEVVE